MKTLSLLTLLLLLSACGQPERGLPGPTGPSGPAAPPTSYTPTNIVDPCGDTPNKYDEVLIIFSNGQVLASFSDNANGNNTRLAIVPPGGPYQTTDGTGCVFYVSSKGTVTW